MKLSVRGLALTVAFVWGVLAMFLTGVAHLFWPGYGREFLQLMSSVYPGYHATGSIGQVIVGSLYGLGDGAIGGAFFAWLYNRLA